MSDTKAEEAVDFLNLVEDAESTNRALALDDLQFAYGEQWPAEMYNSRQLESRPCLTINEVDSYIRQVENQQRQQRPRIRVHPVDSFADIKIAEVITGLCRHVEVNSDADNAYDTAFSFAARIGFGYWRVVTDYIADDSFDQDVFIRSIENPFTVYFDPASTLPDGSDSERVLLTDRMTKKQFRLAYPGADDQGFIARGAGDLGDWVSEHDIRIAEYFYVQKKRDTLVMLSDKTMTWASELPSPEVLANAGITVAGDRPSFRRAVKWCKVSAFETLEEKDWAGKYIPVVPTYGAQMVIDGKLQRYGLVRFSKDAQRMVNFWNTAATESVAMAPKAKWLMEEGQDEGHENEWARANVASYPILKYKNTGVDGKPVPIPQRIQPEPPPDGMMMMVSQASANLQKVIGMYDPAMGKPSGDKSGRAIRAEQGQSEIGSFHLYDNLTRSIKHTGRIILDVGPKVWDKKRVMRIIGEDGSPDLVTINEPSKKEDDEGNAVDVVLNDITVGTYDVVMDTGPGYNTKRLESQDAFVSLMGTALGDEVAKVGADIVVRSFDAPGMEDLADRLAAANPLTQVDKDSDVPPQAQMTIKALQQKLQEAGQQIQQLELEKKYRMDVAMVREDGQNKRAVIAGTVKTHDVEQRDSTRIQTNTDDNETWVKVTAMQEAAGLAGKHIKPPESPSARE